MIGRLMIKKVLMVLTLLILMTSCNSQNNKVSYEEISYHQESFILFDFLTYYHEDFGSFPNDLEELTKLFKNDSIDYSGINKSNIKSNIKDPFSGENLKYTLINDSSFILYSVGSDGVDDNQDVLNKYDKLGRIDFKHFNSTSSTGDLLIYHLENGKVVNDFTDITKLK